MDTFLLLCGPDNTSKVYMGHPCIDHCDCRAAGYMVDNNKNMNSVIQRALVFQGGGSLGAYKAGAYEYINEELSRILKAEGKGNEPVFPGTGNIYRRDKLCNSGKLRKGK